MEVKYFKKFGFTLLEMLVVSALLGTIGLMATSIFFTTLRGGTKAELIKEIKQNGDFAISTMERMIRNARDVTSTCDNTAQPSITILNPDYKTTIFSCGEQIASNSTILTSNKLLVSNCSFICQKPTSAPQNVAIKFTLSQKGSPPRPEERATVTFETTISLRSY